MIVRVRDLALIALGLVSASAFAQTQTPPIPAPRSGTDVLVRLVPGTDARLIDAPIGAIELNSMPQIGWRTVRVPKAFGSNRAVSYYLANSKVLDAHVVQKVSKRDTTVSDPAFSQQYGLRHMKVPAAWDLSTGSPSVIVAILDDGLDLSHPEFQNGKVVPGYDFSNDDADPNPETEEGNSHGTHVAGIAGASTNNSIGMAGIGFNVKIMPLKVFPNSQTPNITRAILYAADNGAKVINMSLGYYGPSDPAFAAAITYANSKGAVVVAAAGNEGLDNTIYQNYPTNYSNVISVGATTSQDRPWSFSNYGSNVLVAAPGVNVYSTVKVDEGGYAQYSGTSMASPAVAGVLALMKSYAPNATVSQLRQALLSTADNVGAGFVATGRINAYKALLALRPAEPTDLEYGTSGPLGGTMAATPEDLKTKNNKWIAQNMKFTAGLGQSAEYVMNFKIPSAVDFSSYVGSSFRLLGKMNAPQSSLQVYLWNFQTGKWQIVSQWTSNGVEKTLSLPLNQAALRDSQRNVRAMIRGLIPIRSGNPNSGGVLSMDVASSTITYRRPIQ